MEMMKQSCEQFLAELAGKAPTPGGGGTAALVGAAGVALGSMVGSLTVGKKKYAAVEADIQALNARADILRKELEALVQADAEAFAPLAAAYGLPKDTPEQAAHKAAVLESALDAACAVPLQIMEKMRRRHCAGGRIRRQGQRDGRLGRRLRSRSVQGSLAGRKPECVHQHKADDRPCACCGTGRKSG